MKAGSLPGIVSRIRVGPYASPASTATQSHHGSDVRAARRAMQQENAAPRRCPRPFPPLVGQQIALSPLVLRRYPQPFSRASAQTALADACGDPCSSTQTCRHLRPHRFGDRVACSLRRRKARENAAAVRGLGSQFAHVISNYDTDRRGMAGASF